MVKQSYKSIVVFGAGKIGRSFIGQLFSRSGYRVVFIDVDDRVISELNRRGKYDVVIKSNNDETIEIDNVCGVLVTDTEAVTEAISECNLMATCVGKNALSKILPALVKGIKMRFEARPDFPLDIILAENIRDACTFIKEGLTALLGKRFPIGSYLGLIETSIGKMVPIMPNEIVERDPLLVYAEPYNTLILDKNGFKNPIPRVEGLSPKEKIKAWVDRKAFIHNLGHAAAAYFGYFKYPERKYLYEVLDDAEVHSFMRKAMFQSAWALIAEYPDTLTSDNLTEHIDDLTRRFMNKQLGDTIFRVGSDLKRKLGGDDRVVGAVKLARKHKLQYNQLIDVCVYGLLFRARDESGHMLNGDIDFASLLETDFDQVLTSVCGLDKLLDNDLIMKIKEGYTPMYSYQR
jgi:mannitol-1-phosphate 5-dehydrogenase